MDKAISQYLPIDLTNIVLDYHYKSDYTDVMYEFENKISEYYDSSIFNNHFCVIGCDAIDSFGCDNFDTTEFITYYLRDYDGDSDSD